ncbi:MAG: hypothetical protein QF537_13450 [SAR324 cluster bacterium]|jgi:hypothetical protein|nr:hypothetical protein [SAR324 cluster bacterium]
MLRIFNKRMGLMEFDWDKFKTIPEMVVTGGTGGNRLRAEGITCYHSPKNGGNRWDHSNEFVTTVTTLKNVEVTAKPLQTEGVTTVTSVTSPKNNGYMESITAAWKRCFTNENYSEEEPTFSEIDQLIFEFEERIAIFEHDALMHREAAEHRALKWIEPRLKNAGIDPEGLY